MSVMREQVTREQLASHLTVIPAGAGGQTDAWPDVSHLTAEIPGLARTLDIVRYRPSLSRVVQEIAELVSALLAPDAAGHTDGMERDLRRIVEHLLWIEQELWRPAGDRLPWNVARWMALAASYIATTQHALAYASRASSDDPDEARAALKSGAQYASEAALAFCRFDVEALRWDEARAKKLEASFGWSGTE